jgi:hypothetical protein
MFLRKIGIALVAVGACSGIWLLGAAMSSLLYFVFTGQSWTDTGARFAGIVILVLVLVWFGWRHQAKLK